MFFVVFRVGGSLISPNSFRNVFVRGILESDCALVRSDTVRRDAQKAKECFLVSACLSSFHLGINVWEWKPLFLPLADFAFL